MPKMEFSTFVISMALYYISDLLSALFSMLWAVSEPLSLNSIFMAFLAVSHFALALLFSWGRETLISIIMSTSSSCIAFVLFSFFIFDLGFLLNSVFPILTVVAGSTLGSLLSSALYLIISKREQLSSSIPPK